MLKKAASGVFAILPGSRTESTLRASKGLRPCWTDFFEHSPPLMQAVFLGASMGHGPEIFNRPILKYGTSASGPTFSEFEIAGALTYSFIGETGKGIATARPHQTLVLTLMMELASESVLTGAEAGENFITLLPGFQLWHPESNWQIQMGVGLPISSDRENDVASHLQVGNHFDWGQLFK